MMFSLAQQGQAPAAFARISRRGVPWMTVAVMAAVLLVGVVLNAVLPESLFLLIASIATFATVWVWLMILLSHIAMKREIKRQVPACVGIRRAVLAGGLLRGAGVHGLYCGAAGHHAGYPRSH